MPCAAGCRARVATSRRHYHVIHSGMFQPFIADESGASMRAQFSVAGTVLREFVEELYGVEELETGDGRVSTDSATYRSWWTTFNDPALNRLIERAYRGNLSLRQASRASGVPTCRLAGLEIECG